MDSDLRGDNMAGEEDLPSESSANLPALRPQGSQLEVTRPSSRLVSRIAGDAYEHLQATDDSHQTPGQSLDFLIESIPSLGVAASCLAQKGRKNLTATQLAIIHLENYADLRRKEIGESIYSKTLQKVADLLKHGSDIGSVIFWIMGARDAYLGFSEGLDQFVTLQSLLRVSEARSPRDEPLEVLQMTVKTRLGLYQQENDEEGVAIYKPLLRLVQAAKSWEEVSQLCQSVQLLNESLDLAKDYLVNSSV
jgi:hypothetical protein